ncbi:hypothetical protein IGI04_006526 [Brassica rapa subsp. trilocularis]|uniref:Secreted protein n=1 Tax=Brassica rapa subsp. trilocularis TaxID=1813537 RepID=A0ABQ7NH52_BRACM|nr:hypothetical protein IGI04_006525 [Brassica rapa subsp. trilocularis]KAG5410207.1 hypothetical protein IGI04_006526 [Brassica rapa subsp. trilocularis]
MLLNQTWRTSLIAILTPLATNLLVEPAAFTPRQSSTLSLSVHARHDPALLDPAWKLRNRHRESSHQSPRGRAVSSSPSESSFTVSELQRDQASSSLLVITGSRPLYLRVSLPDPSRGLRCSILVVVELRRGWNQPRRRSRRNQALDLLQWRLLQYLQDRSPES